MHEIILHNCLSLVEPRFNEVPTDWANWFGISRVRYIGNLDLTNLRENNQTTCYIEGWLIVVFVSFCFFCVVWRRATQQHFGIGTITVNNINALISIWSYSTLYRSVHSYSTLLLKHRGQISVEVTGKRRNKGIELEIPVSFTFYYKKPSKIIRHKRIKPIRRCVECVSVGIYNELLNLKLSYCYKIERFWFL